MLFRFPEPQRVELQVARGIEQKVIPPTGGRTALRILRFAGD
jgi:hypothetical protein